MTHTPLYYAVKQSQYDAAKLLINNGANMDTIKPRYFYSCKETCFHVISLLHIAVIDNNTSIVELLLSSGFTEGSWCDNVSCVHIAIYNSNTDIIRLLYQYGVDVMRKATIKCRSCSDCYRDIDTDACYEYLDDMELTLKEGDIDVIRTVASLQDQKGKNRMLREAYEMYKEISILKALIDIGADRRVMYTSNAKYHKAVYDLINSGV